MICRRSFVGAGTALLTAPAIVKAASLMPVPAPQGLATDDVLVVSTERWGDLGVDQYGREVSALAVFADGKLLGYREFAITAE
jgi:hypothetical protein